MATKAVSAETLKQSILTNNPEQGEKFSELLAQLRTKLALRANKERELAERKAEADKAKVAKDAVKASYNEADAQCDEISEQLYNIDPSMGCCKPNDDDTLVRYRSERLVKTEVPAESLAESLRAKGIHTPIYDESVKVRADADRLGEAGLKELQTLAVLNGIPLETTTLQVLWKDKTA